MGYGPDGHTGIDFAPYNGYGKWLVAPDNVKITNIIDSVKLSDSLDPLKRGYGIVMKSMSLPDTSYLFWHCLPSFPVNIGDCVLKGKLVAQIGNSGNCYRNGIYVPLESRPETKAGTHLHFEMFKEVNGVREYLNPFSYIDFTEEPNYSILEQLSAMIRSIKKIKVGSS
jgi:hypothetical protein